MPDPILVAPGVYTGPKLVCEYCQRMLVIGQQVMVEQGGGGRVFCYPFGCRGCSDKYMAAHTGEHMVLFALCMAEFS